MKQRTAFAALSVASLLSSTAASAGTVAHWDMRQRQKIDQNKEIIEDKGGNSLFGTIFGGQLIGPFLGSGIHLERGPSPQNPDQVEVSDHPLLHFDLARDSFTFEAIFRVDNSRCVDRDGERGIFGKNGDSALQGNSSSYGARLDSPGRFEFFVRGLGDNNNLSNVRSNKTVTDGLDDGNWHHVAAVYTAGAPEILLFADYIQDANTVAVDPFDGVIGANSFPLVIGGWTDTIHEWPGDILHVRISDMALTPYQFQQIIPEPWTSALVLIGLQSIGCANRRRRS
jgi:Concanavalin A-like lectin/glucanases superfamily